MKIYRKGNKEQYVPLDNQLMDPLKMWIEKRKKILGRSKKVKALFISRKKG